MADCSGVRTTGHWKGHRCGSPGLYVFDDKWWCANHFPIHDSIEQMADLKRQLAEARRKAFEEATEVAEKLTPLSGMGVQTGRHIATALRELLRREADR